MAMEVNLEKREFITAGIWLVSGIAIAIGAYRLTVGGFHSPGPGMFPFFLGLALCGCSLPIVIRSLRRKSGPPPEGKELWNKERLRQVILVTIYLVAYALLLARIGYLLTTFIIFFFIFKTMGTLKLRTIFIILILMVTISYYVFAVLLEVPLPLGIWNIGV